MKKINEKKGFTLIELLVVIAILAIVTVLGVTTILPYLNSASEKAFAVEANNVIDAASQAITLKTIGNLDTSDAAKVVEKDSKYCITLTSLNELGLWNKDKNDIGSGKYEGRVVAEKTGKAYTYKVTMKNDTYWVNNTAGGTVTVNNVNKIASTEFPSSAKTTCGTSDF